jgi:hypothetical protein
LDTIPEQDGEGFSSQEPEEYYPSSSSSATAGIEALIMETFRNDGFDPSETPLGSQSDPAVLLSQMKCCILGSRAGLLGLRELASHIDIINNKLDRLDAMIFDNHKSLHETLEAHMITIGNRLSTMEREVSIVCQKLQTTEPKTQAPAIPPRPLVTGLGATPKTSTGTAKWDFLSYLTKMKVAYPTANATKLWMAVNKPEAEQRKVLQEFMAQVDPDKARLIPQ